MKDNRDKQPKYSFIHKILGAENVGASNGYKPKQSHSAEKRIPSEEITGSPETEIKIENTKAAKCNAEKTISVIKKFSELKNLIEKKSYEEVDFEGSLGNNDKIKNFASGNQELDSDSFKRLYYFFDNEIKRISGLEKTQVWANNCKSFSENLKEVKTEFEIASGVNIKI